MEMETKGSDEQRIKIQGEETMKEKSGKTERRNDRDSRDTERSQKGLDRGNVGGMC